MSSSPKQPTVEEIVQAALDAGPEARGALLARLCAGDDSLRRQAERLLAVPETLVDGFLGRPALDVQTARTAAQCAETAVADLPTRVGGYEIVRKIAEGGMGAVYEARQEQPRRSVALKLIRTGLASPMMLRRFMHEAEVLGQLQHPGIAHIYEAGIADVEVRGAVVSRQPFFAMEFVRGASLTEFADAQRLDANRRMVLLALVCDAIHHAHQKGVIHRDLKPGNILIADCELRIADSGRGAAQPADDVECSSRTGRAASNAVTDAPSGALPALPAPQSSQSATRDSQSAIPKILDFGVARLTESDVQMTTMGTDVGQLIGTVPYMSPEQVTGDSRQIDIRSDVYALGVILYELLGGRLPHDVRQRSIVEAARMIRDDEPPRLGSLNPVYRGDVEVIVQKALEKDKSRRYQSAAELAADIRRYLNSEPVSARPASAMYQLRKLARRHTGLVIGLATAFAFLVVGLAATTWFAFSAARERNAAVEAGKRADASAAVATAKAAEATAVNDFLRRMLSSADRGQHEGKELSVADVLDMASKNIDAGELKDQPLVEAATRLTIGDTYRALARYEPAERHLRASLDIRRRVLGENNAATAASHDLLGRLLMDVARPAEARAQFDAAWQTRRTVLGDEDPDAVTSLNNLAAALDDLGQPQDARPLYQRVVAVRRRVLGPRHPYVGISLNNLGENAAVLGLNDEADAARIEAVSIYRETLGVHPVTAVGLNNLGRALHFHARPNEADDYLRDAAEMWERLYGADHPEPCAVWINVANNLRALGQYAEAEDILRLRIARLESAGLHDNRPELNGGIRELAWVCLATGRLDESAALFRRVLTAATPPPQVHVTEDWCNLALALLERGDLDETDHALCEAAEIARTHGVLDKEYGSIILQRRAELAAARGDLDDAERQARAALAIRRRMLSGDHWRIGESAGFLGELLSRRNDFVAAEPLLMEGIANLDGAPDWRFHGMAWERLAAACEREGRTVDAARWRAQAAAQQPP